MWLIDAVVVLCCVVLYCVVLWCCFALCVMFYLYCGVVFKKFRYGGMFGMIPLAYKEDMDLVLLKGTGHPVTKNFFPSHLSLLLFFHLKMATPQTNHPP